METHSIATRPLCFYTASNSKQKSQLHYYISAEGEDKSLVSEKSTDDARKVTYVDAHTHTMDVRPHADAFYRSA